jgi:protein gp37
MGNFNYGHVTKYNRWAGLTFCNDEALKKPLHWRKPRKIFVCSMGDLFHETVPFEFIDKMFAVMALCQHHTFQILTKRPERMAEYMKWSCAPDAVNRTDRRLMIDGSGPIMNHICGFTCGLPWPFENVHLGVTAENQEMADKRIPLLLQTPAAKRFVSIEPMLGAIDLRRLAKGEVIAIDGMGKPYGAGLDLVICGGESGSGARPMHPDWARSLRDQCQAAGVPFYFKQWGEWRYFEYENGELLPDRVGKKKAGHLLDGVEHRPEF